MNCFNKECVSFHEQHRDNYTIRDQTRLCELFKPLKAKKADGSKVPCSDGLLLKLLEEMRTETVECLWDHANAEDLDKQTCESMTSRLEDFFNQKIYDIKRKQ